MDPKFLQALQRTTDDNLKYGQIDSGDWQENGALRAVGIARSDSLLLMTTLLSEYDNEEDLRSPERSTRAETLLAIVEIALCTGVHLERMRWEEHDGH